MDSFVLIKETDPRYIDGMILWCPALGTAKVYVPPKIIVNTIAKFIEYWIPEYQSLKVTKERDLRLQILLNSTRMTSDPIKAGCAQALLLPFLRHLNL